MTNLNKAVERIVGGEAWDETDEVVEVEVKKPLDKVIPIRLSADKWEELRQEAKELGLGPTTLARMWIMEHLRSKSAVGQTLHLSAGNLSYEGCTRGTEFLIRDSASGK